MTHDLILGDVDAQADLAGLVALITSPELPDQHGYVTSSYIAVVELAQRAARTCHTLGNPELTAAVSADVQAEVTAVLAPDRGDLSGRGRQATLLSRTEVSPAQVDAASRQLAANPLDGTVPLTGCDRATQG